MAFVTWVKDDPAFSGVQDATRAYHSIPAGGRSTTIWIDWQNTVIGDPHAVKSPVFNTNGTNFDRWVSITDSSGGGGSVRPTSGVLYPRGQS